MLWMYSEISLCGGQRYDSCIDAVSGTWSTLKLNTSAKHISVWAAWLRQNERASSEPSETPWCQIIPRLPSIPRVRLHITVRSLFNLSSRSIYVKLGEDSNKVRRYDSSQRWGSTQLRESTKSRKERVRAKVGIDRVCIFDGWQDEIRMRCCLSTPGSPEYIYCIAHSTSMTPVCPYTLPCSITISLESMIDLVWGCTWSPISSELRDALEGRDRSSLEMIL
jgi:hypothetical protein